jgi:hypothetical protein
MYTKKRLALSEPFVSYFFLPDPNVGCQPPQPCPFGSTLQRLF